jgi:hypothetical protein
VVGSVQACTAGTETGTINTANFNYLRIEVRANNDIHFFVDTNTSNGIVETECGTGVTGTGPAATDLSPTTEVAFMTNSNTTENLDIDFVRVWQDDPSIPTDVNALQGASNVANGEEPSARLQTAALPTAYDPVMGADVSEYYEVVSPTEYSPGDVVSIDAGGGAKVRKSDKAYDNSLLGVVSTSSAVDLGQHDDRAIKVAVGGRAPVKVSTENGPIAPGDLLTASSVPGVAMKATKAGATLGQALDGFSGTGMGQVLVRLNVTGHKASVDASDLQAGPIDQATIGSLTVTGDMVVAGNATFRGKVAVNDIEIGGHVVVNADVAGTATIKVGSSSVDVKFGKAYAAVPVVTTGSDDFVTVRVTNKTVNGFTVQAQSPVVRDVHVDWTALEPKPPPTIGP